MARIEDEIGRIQDTELRKTLLEEVRKLKEKRQFGLVFEEHLPEVVPINSASVRPRVRVAQRTANLTETYYVRSVNGRQAELVKNADGRRETLPVESLVVIKRFGEPIYPALVPMGKVENGGNAPYHTLIEADNYHALQLLEYLYAGKVDCIYIDPPYNTGARDWKYNNDYVDKADSWRHSKWLSFMQRRLRLAKNLLKPDTGVLIVTVDEHEVHHLRTLLDAEFPAHIRQMVTIVINPKGVTQGKFARVEEHAIFCFGRNATVVSKDDDLLSFDNGSGFRTKKVRWKGLLRSGTDSARKDRESMFYPVWIDPDRGAVLEAGSPLPLKESPTTAKRSGRIPVWPIRDDPHKSEGRWSVGGDTLNGLIRQGYVALGRYDARRRTYSISYLSKVIRAQIDSGAIFVTGFDRHRNVVSVEYAESKLRSVKTVWHRSQHDAGAYGSDLLTSILGKAGTFSFPKSLYSVRDSLLPIISGNRDALILDFFAGSGTTLNAVCLLNAADGGHRQCILVTNNEVSEEETKTLTQNRLQPGHPDWEKHGICQSVTFPRCKYTILGKRDDGTPVPGEYLTGRTVTKEKPRNVKQLGFVEGKLLTLQQRKQLVALVDGIPQSKLTAEQAFFVDAESIASILFDAAEADAYLAALEEQEHITDFYIVTQDNRLFNRIKQEIQELLGPALIEEEEKRPLSQGFSAKLEYFKLDFLDPNEVAMGRQFEAILPILWMMAGAKDKRPESNGRSPYLIPANCPLAVLFQEKRFAEFKEKIKGRNDLTHIFLVTNSEDAFFEMKKELDAPHIVMLYKNYLENFKLNTHRE